MAELGNYGGFLDQLLAALKKRANYNEDLIGQRNRLETQFYNPPEPREAFKGVWNPYDRVKLAEGRRAQAGTSLNTFNDLIKSREGSMADTAAAVARGYQEQQEAEQQAWQRGMAEKQFGLSARAAARADRSEQDARVNPAELMGAYPSMFGRQGPDNPAGPKLPPSIIFDVLQRQAAQQESEKDRERQLAAKVFEFMQPSTSKIKIGEQMETVPGWSPEKAKSFLKSQDVEKLPSFVKTKRPSRASMIKTVRRWMQEKKSKPWIEQKINDNGWSMEELF